MLYALYAIHVLICLFLIMVVLLQQGSGADLSVFGGGGTQTAFGARSATSLLHRLTVAAFVGFIVTTIAIGFMKSSGSDSSVMSGVEETVPDSPDAPDSEEAVDEIVPGVELEVEPANPATELAEPSEPSSAEEDNSLELPAETTIETAEDPDGA